MSQLEQARAGAAAPRGSAQHARARPATPWAHASGAKAAGGAHAPLRGGCSGAGAASEAAPVEQQQRQSRRSALARAEVAFEQLLIFQLAQSSRPVRGLTSRRTSGAAMYGKSNTQSYLIPLYFCDCV